MFIFGKNKAPKRRAEISLAPLRFQVVTPEEFIEIYNERSSEILSAKIVPPKLGSNDFGKILVEWKNPVYAPLSEFEEGVFAY